MNDSRFTPSTLEARGLADRIERLRTDAADVAAEHTDLFVNALAEAAGLANQVAEGGEAYGPGVREIARRAYLELTNVVLSLRAIHQRSH